MATEHIIHVRNLNKSFGGARVLKDITFSVQPGELISIVGPSGCGKSTILNVLSRILPPDSGSSEVRATKMGYDGLAYMMQDSLLLPWKTLWDNAMLGGIISGGDVCALTSRCEELFRELDLTGARNLLPEEASGGMLRRVALIRSLACLPNILLLDEPFANLDFDVKLRAQRCLLKYRRAGITVVLVTHDVEDAIILADRVIVLSPMPAMIKSTFDIPLSLEERDPVRARTTPAFNAIFSAICRDLRYLEPNGN